MSKTQDLIKQEQSRQQATISLIASENAVSKEVLKALGSVFTNKYAEGYPGKRYYGGCEIADVLESQVIAQVKELFGAEYVNVQPYSGTPANMAVYLGLLTPGDTILSMNLSSGGHLSHGHKLSFAGKFFNIVHYDVDPSTGLIDYGQIAKLAKAHKPKMIVCGASAYSRKIDFVQIKEIADKAGAMIHADIAHIAGLIAAGLHPNPVPYFDVVTSTTHKTLRGPRGGLIMAKAEYGPMIDKAVFPLLQGGPHLNNIAALGVALEEARKPAFKKYAKQVVKNAQALAKALAKFGYKIITNGTDNHLLLVDVTTKGLTGQVAEVALGRVGIIINKNMIPGDTRKPLDPSGIRLGTPLVTTRGMAEKEMVELAYLMAKVLESPEDAKTISEAKKEVKRLTSKFKLPH
jgi:glycine hydroxymethyltransferase